MGGEQGWELQQVMLPGMLLLKLLHARLDLLQGLIQLEALLTQCVLELHYMRTRWECLLAKALVSVDSPQNCVDLAAVTPCRGCAFQTRAASQFVETLVKALVEALQSPTT